MRKLASCELIVLALALALSRYVFDAFNATNRVQFGAPNLNATQAGFGTITGQDNRPRAIQMALRLKW
jgi:hypothetical protein